MPASITGERSLGVKMRHLLMRLPCCDARQVLEAPDVHQRLCRSLCEPLVDSANELMGFVHVQLSPDTWLTACAACRRVLAFAANELDLVAAEAVHNCSHEGPVALPQAKQDEAA